MDLTVCGQISECRATVQRLKRNALCELESQENMDFQYLGSRNEDELRDEIDLSFRGQVIDNVGQQSLLPAVIDTNEGCLNRDQIVDNVGQQSSRLISSDNYELTKDEIISTTRSQFTDYYDQGSPPHLISFNDVCLGQVVDNVGQRSPRLFPDLNH